MTAEQMIARAIAIRTAQGLTTVSTTAADPEPFTVYHASAERRDRYIAAATRRGAAVCVKGA